jgi:hypothetical protein
MNDRLVKGESKTNVPFPQIDPTPFSNNKMAVTNVFNTGQELLIGK